VGEGSVRDGVRAAFPCGKPDGAKRLHVFAFAHAGGSVSLFRRWQAAAPPDVAVCPVQLPWRDLRSGEPPLRSATAIVDLLLDALLPHLHRPFVLLGHSMGARVAFALTQALEKARHPCPRLLVVSGNPSPCAVVEQGIDDEGLCSDERLTDYIRSLGGTPDELLADAKTRSAILALVRADFCLYHSLTIEYASRVAAAVLAFAGGDDASVPIAAVLRWRYRTRSSFLLRVVPGGHFYPESRDAAALMLGMVRAAAL
jgi:medium-chain acyl-[acyl-carrier-protein] hydrolase